MQFLVVLSCALACAVASPAVVGYSSVVPVQGVAYSSYYVAPQPVAVPIAGVHAQYHSQDLLGRASYGHAEPLQAHNAVQDAAGNKVGSFSYLAPNGQVVRTDYVADAAGYRVASNALPLVAPIAGRAIPQPVQDTPEVAAAKAAHLAEVAAVRARSKRDVAAVLPAAYAAPVAYSTPVAYSATAAAPYTVPAYSAYSAYPAVAPVSYAVPSVARVGALTTLVNNPGHAVSYQIN